MAELNKTIQDISVVRFVIDEKNKLPEGIQTYIQSIKSILNEMKVDSTKYIGAIVMNCNPFTYGHQYLIDTARKLVDVLLIFVVSEDKSIFSFDDRFEMVKRATALLENEDGSGTILVFPSGKYMISQDTFPEYFYKSDIQGKTIDTTYDVSIFAEYIAPALGIKIRFVGQEPNDTVTENYNRTMERILHQHGIEFREIPRLSDTTGAITATRVRRCMQIGDIEELKRLIPETSLEIVAKYMQNTNIKCATWTY